MTFIGLTQPLALLCFGLGCTIHFYTSPATQPQSPRYSRKLAYCNVLSRQLRQSPQFPSLEQYSQSFHRVHLPLVVLYGTVHFLLKIHCQERVKKQGVGPVKVYISWIYPVFFKIFPKDSKKKHFFIAHSVRVADQSPNPGPRRKPESEVQLQSDPRVAKTIQFPSLAC